MQILENYSCNELTSFQFYDISRETLGKKENIFYHQKNN